MCFEHSPRDSNDSNPLQKDSNASWVIEWLIAIKSFDLKTDRLDFEVKLSQDLRTLSHRDSVLVYENFSFLKFQIKN